MGLLNTMGINNGFTDFLGSNRHTLIGLGAGMTESRNLRDAAHGATQGIARGFQANSANAIRVAEEDARKKQIAEEQARQNKTLEFLKTRLSAEDFAAVDAGVISPSDAFNALTGTAEKPPVSFGTPIWGTDANGNTGMGVLNNRGEFSIVDTKGFNIGKDPIRVDAGTKTILLDPVTRQAIGEIPKDNYGAAYDSASGTATGKYDAEKANLAPQAIANGESMMLALDELLNDPNLDTAVGVGGVLPAIPGTPQAGVVARIQQIQGKTFLEAYERLKGGGVITEIEGTKAEQAIARLNRVQSPQDFKLALKDLRDVISAGLARQRAKIGGGSVPAAAPSGVVNWKDL